MARFRRARTAARVVLMIPFDPFARYGAAGDAVQVKYGQFGQLGSSIGCWLAHDHLEGCVGFGWLATSLYNAGLAQSNVLVKDMPPVSRSLSARNSRLWSDRL
jgi:hypothetical protein